MTLRKWQFNVSPSGTALTTANTLADDGAAATTMAPTGTGAWTSSNLHPHSGGFGARLQPSGTTTHQARLPFVATNNRAALCAYHWADSLPPANMNFINIRHPSGQLFRLSIGTNGAISITDASGVGIVGSAAGAWQAGRLNRMEAFWDNSGGTAAGTCTFAVYNADATTADATISTTTANLGTAATASVDLGNPNFSGSTWVQFFDLVQMDDGRASFIGPAAAANQAPTANAGPDQTVDSDATVTLTGTGTDPEGQALTYAWTQTGGPAVTLTGSGANRTFTAPIVLVDTALTFSLTTTDPAGASSPADTVVVTVLEAPTRIWSGTAWIPGVWYATP